MDRYLMTQSLLSSFAYQFSCSDEVMEDANQAFMRTLHRMKEAPTEAMLNGINFENEVYKLAGGYQREQHKKWESGIQKVASVIQGAPVQIKVSREITVDGIPFLVYGILDAMKAGTIYDVKFKDKPFSKLELAGNYLDSPQHPAYFYMVPEAQRFVYLVSDGQELYREEYTPDASPSIGSLIHEFLSGISREQMEIYKKMWLAK